jgi:NADH:ubiquinone oxidoreductase subunit 6 (subunit J)
MTPFVQPLVAPAVLGALAVYLLLPRPRPFPRALGVTAGLAALVLGGFALVRRVEGAGPLVEWLLFGAFSALALAGGVALVTQTNAARGAVAFALVVLSTCGLFLLQAAPFLMAGTIIIYAGAIVVTFLFVIMLSQQRGLTDADARSREPLAACLAGGLLLAVLLAVIRQHYDPTGLDNLIAAVDAATVDPSSGNLTAVTDRLGRVRLAGPVRTRLENSTDALTARAERGADPEVVRRELLQLRADVAAARDHVGDVPPPDAVRLSRFAGPPPSDAADNRLPAANVAALGRALFSDYLLAVELGGTLLLVATIGAIAITHRTARGAA